MNYVIDELKAQAGKIGANGIVLMSSGAQNGGAVAVAAGTGLVAVPFNKQGAQGQAIFVAE